MQNPAFSQLKDAIHLALESWTAADKEVPPLLAKLLIVKQQNEGHRFNGTVNWRRLVNEILLAGIGELERENSQGARILRARFLDGLKATAVAHGMNLSRDQLNRRQRAAIAGLTRIVLAQELTAQAKRLAELEGNLPPASYEGALVGLDDCLPMLVEQVLAMAAPWTLALTGIGGIGKTSLADGLVRRVLRHFVYEQVVWVRVEAERPFANLTETIFTQIAQQLNLPLHLTPTQQAKQVRHTFKQVPHLLVIDNVEAETDTINLLLHLTDLTNPSKIVLTTRTRPPGHIAVWSYPLDELSVEATAVLVRHHAQTIGLQDLAAPTAAQIAEVYGVTGGNPLAIKLVVGLAQVMPLRMVLQDLHRVQTQEVEAMYRHIYWRAWRSLSEAAQKLLKMMPLAADIGLTPSHMMAISSLPEETFWPTVYELVNRSLLEVRGTTWERRYGIHRLTDSFLRTEIVGWEEAVEA